MNMHGPGFRLIGHIIVRLSESNCGSFANRWVSCSGAEIIFPAAAAYGRNPSPSDDWSRSAAFYEGQLLRLPEQIQNALVHILNRNRQLCLANRKVQELTIQFT